MPNKAWDKLNPIDAKIRRLFPVGMEQGIKLKIELICGFEKFNTRAYHNYETWSDGYRVVAYKEALIGSDCIAAEIDAHKDPNVIMIEQEDLDDAINVLEAEMIKREWIRVSICAD